MLETAAGCDAQLANQMTVSGSMNNNALSQVVEITLRPSRPSFGAGESICCQRNPGEYVLLPGCPKTSQRSVIGVRGHPSIALQVGCPAFFITQREKRCPLLEKRPSPRERSLRWRVLAHQHGVHLEGDDCMRLERLLVRGCLFPLSFHGG